MRFRGAGHCHGNTRFPLSASAVSPWEQPSPRLQEEGAASPWERLGEGGASPWERHLIGRGGTGKGCGWAGGLGFP